MKLIRFHKGYLVVCLLVTFMSFASNAYAIDRSSINFSSYAIFNDSASNSTIEIDTVDSDAETITIQLNVYGDQEPSDFGFMAVGYDSPINQFQLFDDGTHGDKTADDHIYTIGGLKTAVSELPERGFLRLWMRVNVDGVETDMYYPCLFIVEKELCSYVERDDFVISDYMVNYYSLSLSSTEDYREQIANHFYNSFGDDYNFIFIYQEGSSEWSGSYSAVKNDISGIAIQQFDSTSLYGSDGMLEGIIYYAANDYQIIAVPNCIDFHEIGHRWAAYLDDPRLDLSYDGAHWKNNTTIFGMMNACCGPFVYNGDGTFTRILRGDYTNYSPLELYLMGVISPEELDASMEIYILNDPDIKEDLNDNIPYDSIYEPESYIKITSSDIISVYGERIPDYLSAPKHFNAAVLMITKRKMTVEEVTLTNKIFRHYSEPYDPEDINGENWYAVPSFSNYTNNKMSLDFSIINESLDSVNDSTSKQGFDYLSYLSFNSDLPQAWSKAECMEHYRLFGFNEHRAVSFNLEEYLNANPDLPSNWTYEQALSHYIVFGRNENRLLAFDGQEYMSLYPDLPQDWTFDQAYAHYIYFGKKEGRIASFDETAYLELYPDLPRAWGQTEAFYHYLLYGVYEGRVYDPYDEDVFDSN